MCNRRAWHPVTRKSSSARTVLWMVPDPRKFNVQWKTAFMDHYLAQRNWLCGQYGVARNVSPVTEGGSGTLCLQFDDNLRDAASMDYGVPSRLHLWRVLSGKTRLTLDGHEGAVAAVRLTRRYVVSGGADRTIRVWSRDSGECLKVINAHDDEVECLCVDENIACSGSSDFLLKVGSVLGKWSAA